MTAAEKRVALDAAERQFKWAIRSESRERLAAMLAVAASEPGIPILPAELDRAPWAFNVLNGTLDLRTGELRGHRREDYITQLAPVEYHADAPCPAWERFLAAVFAAGDGAGNTPMIRFVQRLLGRSLTADVSEQVLAVFWGAGANGKSTLVNTVMGVMGRDYATQAAPDLLFTGRGDRHPTELADLHGRRLVVTMESGRGVRLNEVLLKQITGGDRVKGRRMREDFWDFDPTHKLILCTNHRPRVAGSDVALWRRVRLVPFAVTFWNPDDPAQNGAERPEHLRQDKHLTATLRAESEGILAWLVRGCLDWREHGLGVSPEVGDATRSYREEQDLVGRFLAEECVVGRPQDRVKASVLFAAFRHWAEAAGERDVPDRNEFGARLTEKGIERFTSNGTWYRGVSFCERA